MASSKSVIKNMTAVDSAALDCSVCVCPLKPPIFQCDVGHMVCSECKEKMAAAETCHVCRRTLSGGYKRCYGAEHIVECLRVPCPNKACSVRLARYDKSAHLQSCEYRPFHCPAEDCTFVTGDLVLLRNHFFIVHSWPSTSVDDGTTKKNLVLVDGFNLIESYPARPKRERLLPRPYDLSHLVLLKVTRESYGRVVTPILIRPRKARKCRLKLAYETPCGTHCLEYAFNVASTDLSTSSGPSSPDGRFNFILPKSIQPLDVDTIKVAFKCRYDNVES